MATALFARQACERLVEQQQLRFLRERHSDLDAPLFAVRDHGERFRREMRETDALQYRARFNIEMRKRQIAA